MENAAVVLAVGGARAAGPGLRRRWRRVGVTALALAAVAGVGYWFWLLYWSQRLFRALFLPGNLQFTLHVVEVGLLAVLGLLLLARTGRRREVWVVGLPGGREIELRGATVLGSDAAVCDVVIDSTVVSRRHAELKPAAGDAFLRDLGSTNGTFVEGRDLRGRAAVALAAGDSWVLGDNGPELSLARVPAAGLLSGPFWLPLLGLFLVSGLIVGFRGNLQRLPGEPIVVGQTAVDFAPFRELVPVLIVGLALGLLLLGAGFAWSGRKGRRGRNELEEAAAACLLFIVAGAVALYSLLPAVGLRYARAAERAREEIGAPGWSTLESWERGGGKVLEVRRALLSGEGASEIPAELRTVARSRQELATVLARYSDGRAALRWAINLGARAGEPFLAVTYYLQALVLALVAALALVVPRVWPAWARAARGALVRLARPLSPRFVRAADGGTRVARALRPLAYPDVLLGFAAAGLVAATLWSPFGSTLGRGKSLYLDLPGIPPLQVVELVKGLFVLFVAGYFARYGELLARTARPRYLVPFALAAFGTLALTAVQADLGGLFMLALFLGIVFVVATGQLRLVAAVPALLVPGLALAWKLGHASIVGTRVGIWLAPRSAPLGEQLVEARQLLLSSGWAGHPPGRALAAEIPDIHGDLVIAALAERFGFIGVAALLVAGFVFVVSLLRAARRAERPAALLLVGLAALFLVQTLAQIGGTTGLLPLTGVPLPWLSHGLTASLVFTLLLGLAVAASAGGSGEIVGSATANAAEHSHLSAHLRAFTWFAAGIALVLVAAVAWWTVALPAQRLFGPRGADYRWRDTRLEDLITQLIGAGVFVAAGDEARVRVDAGAVSRLRRAGVAGAAAQPVPDNAELGRLADGLRVRAGVIEALPWLVSRGNRFAVRVLPRGRVLTADGVAIALTDSRGRRLYPRGSGYFHPLGYAGGLTQGIGVEDAAGETLRGLGLSPTLRLRMFAEDVQHGPDVVLTLDSRVQERAYELLAGRRGATVAIDLESGGLLALASSPSVAPMGAKAGAWRERLTSADQPLRDRAIDFTHDYSPPGSVFKIVMAAAILAGGSGVDPNERVSCNGHDAELNISCAHGRAHGAVDLERALAVSCNIYFAHAAVALGEERIHTAARRLGFNAAASLDLLRELPGAELLAARSTVLTDRAGRPLALRPRDLARVGYGQGPIDATPMDIARMGAVIASGGRAVEPVLAQALELSRPDSAGAAETVWRDEIAGSDGSDGGRVLPGLVAVQLQELLRGVFEHPEGTARRLPKLWHAAGRYQLATTAPGDEWEHVSVAGKTGSAWRSRSDSSDDAWMVLWAPAEGARVVVATLVEDAGEGGKIAGPIALEVLRLALERSESPR